MPYRNVSSVYPFNLDDHYHPFCAVEDFDNQT
eukprot:CAMPEP_0202970278 /NCGR_PEP_ID=MMETSP1396-20130829/16257_1 /ASSEMBLY_ACC=CAM_ASM_000872 /TAXON_ID= /ORGANISM="Pseudokeronopsis sp., Strain Brazil" /LENGTH=31 /DNA_ID= /DNA_START= /DNA_END= /DNA_ORIENTATION=